MTTSTLLPVYVRASQIAGPTGMLPIGLSTWHRWVQIGKAPKPYQLSDGVTVWKLSEVLDFIEGRLEAHHAR